MSVSEPARIPGFVRRTAAVMRHEVRLAFHSPMSYVLALGFVLGMGLAIFAVGEFLSTNEASVRLFTLFLPWVAIVFVPALAMRAWSAGHDDRGLEFAMSLPLGDGALVTGKFLAGLVVLVFVLALAAVFPATIMYLGEPDPGATVGAWLAALLLLAAFHAVALAAAAITVDATAAFVAGACALFALVMAGTDGVARRLDDWLPGWSVDVVMSFGPRRWIEELASGRIGAGALAYFGVLLVLALVIARGLVASRRTAAPKRAMAVRAAGGVVVLAAVLGAATSLAERWGWFVDISEEREHTLSPGTRAIVEALPVETGATLFWSADQEGIPSAIRTHARRARAMLDALARSSGGKLVVGELDPRPDSETEIAALEAGMRRVPMTSGDAFFLGVELRHGDRTLPVPYLDVDRAQLLEYDIASALSALVRERTPSVAVLSPLVAPSAVETGREGLSFLAELRATVDLAVVPYFADELPADLDVLLVVDAPVLKRSMLRSIDRLVARGGTLIVLLDPFARFNWASRRTRPAPSEEIDDITDLVAAYGFRFDVGKVVGDETFAAPVSIGGAGATGYPFWIRVSKAGLAASHPVTGALRELLFAEPGALDIDAGRGIVPLAVTSARAGRGGRDARVGVRVGRRIARPRGLRLRSVPERRHRRFGRGVRSSVRGRGRGLDLRSLLRGGRRCRRRQPGAPHQRQPCVPVEHGRVRERCRAARRDSIERTASPAVHSNRAAVPRGRGGHAGGACGTCPPDRGRRGSHREVDRRLRGDFSAAAPRRDRGGGRRASPGPCAVAPPPA